jgi:hypothetical protein
LPTGRPAFHKRERERERERKKEIRKENEINVE